MSTEVYHLQIRRRQNNEDPNWKWFLFIILTIILISLVIYLEMGNTKNPEFVIDIKCGPDDILGIKQVVDEHKIRQEKIDVFPYYSKLFDKLNKENPSLSKSEDLSTISKYLDSDLNGTPDGIKEASASHSKEKINSKILGSYTRESNSQKINKIISIVEVLDSSSEINNLIDVINAKFISTESNIISNNVKREIKERDLSNEISSSETSTENAFALPESAENEIFSKSVLNKYSVKIKKLLKNLYPRVSISKNNDSSMPPPSQSEAKDKCDSTVCKDEASNMLSLIDRDESACDNFYKYSCHGMLNPRVAEMDFEADVWRRLEDGLNKIHSNSPVYLTNYKSYYESCVNYDPVLNPDTRENFIQQISYLASFYDETVDMIPPTCQIITDLLKRNFEIFFDLKLDIAKKSRKIELAIVPSTFDSLLKTFMGDNSYVEKCMSQNKPKTSTVDLHDLYDEYKHCKYDVDSLLKTTRAALLYADAFSNSANQMEHINETLDMLRNHIIPILQKYAPHPSEVKTDVEINNFESIYVNDLKERAENFINFELVFTSVFGNAIVDDDTEIQFYFWENFENIFKNIPFDEMRKVHNAIFAIYVQSVFRDFVLMRNEPFDRHKICLKSATELLPDISSYIYMKSFDEKEIESSNQFVKEIFAKINSTLEHELQLGDFLVESDYEEAQKIMSDMTIYTIDTYKPWENEQFLIDRHLNVSLTGDFINDTFRLQQEYRKLMYNQYPNNVMYPNIMWTYFKTPYDTKLSVIKNTNTIVIPMGAIQHYKTNDEIPNYLIMADIGFKLAKEIVIQLEMKNIKIFVGERETVAQNFIIGDLMESQHSIFKLNNSILFSKDIISDSAAAKLTYFTIQRQYENADLPLLWLDKSWMELYFIRLSQNICTKQSLLDTWINMFENNQLHPIIKVNTIAINSEEFLKIFDCKSRLMEGSIKLYNSKHEDTDYTIEE